MWCRAHGQTEALFTINDIRIFFFSPCRIMHSKSGGVYARKKLRESGSVPVQTEKNLRPLLPIRLNFAPI